MAGPTEPPTLESDGAAAKPRRVAIGRKRRALGATLLGLGTIVAVLWLASGWWSGGYVGARWGAGLQKGYGGVYWLDGTMPEDLQGARISRNQAASLMPQMSFWGQANALGVGGVTVHSFGFGYIERYSPGSALAAFVLWPYPLLLWGTGAAFLRSGFRARRRSMSNHCGGCSYDLTGLGSRACPECGKRDADHARVAAGEGGG